MEEPKNKLIEKICSDKLSFVSFRQSCWKVLQKSLFAEILQKQQKQQKMMSKYKLPQPLDIENNQI